VRARIHRHREPGLPRHLTNEPSEVNWNPAILAKLCDIVIALGLHDVADVAELARSVPASPPNFRAPYLRRVDAESNDNGSR